MLARYSERPCRCRSGAPPRRAGLGLEAEGGQRQVEAVQLLGRRGRDPRAKRHCPERFGGVDRRSRRGRRRSSRSSRRPRGGVARSVPRALAWIRRGAGRALGPIDRRCAAWLGSRTGAPRSGADPREGTSATGRLAGAGGMAGIVCSRRTASSTPYRPNSCQVDKRLSFLVQRPAERPPQDIVSRAGADSGQHAAVQSRGCRRRSARAGAVSSPAASRATYDPCHARKGPRAQFMGSKTADPCPVTYETP